MAQLDLTQFEAALADPSCLNRLATDHVQADEMDIFGTPTFAFPGSQPAYLKLGQVPERDEAIAFWYEFRRIVTERAFVVEIKRPH